MRAKTSLKESYYQLLKGYVTRPGERHLAAAADLGRRMIEDGVPIEEIAKLHEQALARFQKEIPQKKPFEAAALTSAPLMELLMAYGLAFREQWEKQQLVERDLFKREQEIRTLLEHCPDIILRFDKELRHIYVNPAVEQVTGIRHENFIGKTHQELDLPGDMSTFWQKSLRKVFATGKQDSVYFEYPTPKGKKYFESRVVPEFGQDRTVESVLVIARDISEHKQVEEKLQEQLWRNQQILQTMLDGFILADTQGQLIEVNPAYCRMIGYPREELLQMNIRELEGQLSPQEIERRIDSMLKQGSDRFQTKHIRKDGRRIDLEVSIVIMQPGETPLVAAFLHDITEHKQDEERLRAYAQRLEILHDIDQGMLAADSLPGIARAALSHMRHLLPCQWITITEFDFEAGELTRLAASPGMDSKLSEKSRYSIKEYSGDIELLRQGKVFHVEDVAKMKRPPRIVQDLRVEGLRSYVNVPILLQKELIGALNLAADQPGVFTAQHLEIAREVADSMAIAFQHWRLYEQVQNHAAELKERVAERTRELQMANAELESFSYSVSHDLRAPLRAISGFSQIIARRHRADLNEQGRHYFDNIVEAGEQMAQLIDDLLNYSRMGRGAVQCEPVPLGEVLARVAEHLAERISESGARLTIPENLPVVWGVRTLLNQIFSNLLNNALTYRRPRVPLRITIGCRLEDDYAIVRVADNGIGIAAEYHEKIFTIFQRLHGQEDYPGTGIGLAIAKKAVELLDGHIWVESREGKGSEFFVKLPLSKSNSEHY